jgi:ribonuclease-3
MKARQKSVEGALGYHFRDPALLEIALTPPSTGLPEDNQRLEFLGDSVLHLAASLLVFREHPEWSEGALSKLRGMIVCTDALVDWAKDMGLVLEKGPRSAKKVVAGGERKALADAVEALLAAVYLDALPFEPNPLVVAARIIEARFGSMVQSAVLGIWESQDAKTTLQEWAAHHQLPSPAYELLEKQGPDHAPQFMVKVCVGSREAQATAGTLKKAQTEAARRLLESLQRG